MLMPDEPVEVGQGLPLIYGKLVKFEPIFNEVKVMEGDQEKSDEADQLNRRLQSLREQYHWIG